ncbi:MAG: 1-acyl-sn-glycerol-3-phosphate acyltransferase [Alphaproteobacteria bacterium]|nr:1-acyl-sn-glycerol-3-phosphate acyltransferase [Alphaproteobacteria bacterium]
MSNHLSYLDIPLLGSIIKASFVSKSEVAKWPVFGYLATLVQTVFIQRKRSATGNHVNILQERINAGDSLIIFPEGTSTSGLNVLPFKSSLFSLAINDNNENLYIQPVTIKILEIDGHAPQSKEEHNIYAWPFDDDIELSKHLTRFAKITKTKIRITFHPTLKASDYNDRKVLAKACYEAVNSGL